MTPSEYCRVRAPRHCTSAVYRPAVVTRIDRLIRFLTAGAATVSSPALLSEREHADASGVSSCSSKRPRPTRNVERKPRPNVPVSKMVWRVNRWPGRVAASGSAGLPRVCPDQRAEPPERCHGIDPPEAEPGTGRRSRARPTAPPRLRIGFRDQRSPSTPADGARREGRAAGVPGGYQVGDLAGARCGPTAPPRPAARRVERGPPCPSRRPRARRGTRLDTAGRRCPCFPPTRRRWHRARRRT